MSVLQGEEPIEEPPAKPNPDGRRTIDQVRQIQKPYWKNL
jgi:hypothetical protein